MRRFPEVSLLHRSHCSPQKVEGSSDSAVARMSLVQKVVW